tara:strand:- start:7148 stop:7342 length:195 start_codon:yes stop_codon:yes gene_type:complete
MKKTAVFLTLSVALLATLPACGNKKNDCKPCASKKVETKEVTKKSNCVPCQKAIKGGKEDYAIA